jgi:protease I
MAHIAVIIDDMFEDSEYTEPAKAFKAAGHKLTHIGLKENTSVKGKSEGTQVTIDQAVKDVAVEDFDALLIPGGYSPDHLRADEAAVKFVKKFFQGNKPVFAI